VFLYIVFITGVRCFLIYLNLKRFSKNVVENYVRSFTECSLYITLHDARSNESTWDGYLAFSRKPEMDTKCWLGVTWEGSNWYKIKIDIWACGDKKRDKNRNHGKSSGTWHSQFGSSVRCRETCCLNYRPVCTIEAASSSQTSLHVYVTTQNTVTFTATAT
jgi:hypothetical protein